MVEIQILFYLISLILLNKNLVKFDDLIRLLIIYSQ